VEALKKRFLNIANEFFDGNESLTFKIIIYGVLLVLFSLDFNF